MKWLFVLISTCSIFAGLYVNSVRADSGYVWCSTDNWDVDNLYKGKTELKLHGPLGYYFIRIEMDGYIAFQQKIHLSKDMDVWASLLRE